MTKEEKQVIEFLLGKKLLQEGNTQFIITSKSGIYNMNNIIQEYSDQQNKALIKEVEGLKEKLMQSSIDYDVMEIANESLHKLLEELKQIKRLKAMFTGKNKEILQYGFVEL